MTLSTNELNLLAQVAKEQLLEYGGLADDSCEFFGRTLQLVERGVETNGSIWAILEYDGEYFRMSGYTHDRPDSWSDFGYRSSTWDGTPVAVEKVPVTQHKWVATENTDSWGNYLSGSWI